MLQWLSLDQRNKDYFKQNIKIKLMKIKKTSLMPKNYKKSSIDIYLVFKIYFNEQMLFHLNLKLGF